MDVLAFQDISPQQPCQCTVEGEAEGAVVDSQRHAVDRCPEGAVGDGQAVGVVDGLPGLDDA